MQLNAIHINKEDEALRVALLEAGDNDPLCAILMLDLPELPAPPVITAFPTRADWRRALVSANEAWVEQWVGGTLRYLDQLGLNPRGGYLGQVVVHGPACAIRSALSDSRRSLNSLLPNKLHICIFVNVLACSGDHCWISTPYPRTT